ncbi:MAG TPA: hypothetical protein VFZ19_01270 [Solirubrobacterales bacterium]
MPRESRNLQDLAVDAGFTVDSLAQVTGLNRATIYRYWLHDDWLQRIGHAALRQIMSVVPGVEQLVGTSVLEDRRQLVTERLQRLGAPVRNEQIDAALSDPEIEPQYLFTALAAAAHIINEEVNPAIYTLRSLWGRSQTRALDVVFGTHRSYSALENPKQLTEAASHSLAKIRQTRNYTFQRAVAQAHLAHHIGKCSGELVAHARKANKANSGVRVLQTESFFLRGSYMGVLRQEDNLDTAQEYAQCVSRDPIVRLIECWAFPSWSGDLESMDEYRLPRNVSLSSTATEVIKEIQSYNEAYVWYLAATFVPLALENIDPNFGGQLSGLRNALEEKAEETSLQELQEECTKLAKRIAAAEN